MKYYSQSGQDEFVDKHVFQGKRDGFFLDIGAHDGVSLSNTYVLEQERGWRGICVEPIPGRFEECRKNRRSICIQGCIAKSPGPSKFVIAQGVDMLSALACAASQEHYDRIRNEGATPVEVEVQCYTFNDIVATHDVKHIDFCSIDTEGAELEILATIDFAKYRPTCFTVEDNGQVVGIWRLLHRNGYSLVERLGGDLIFVDRNFAHRMPRVGFLRRGSLARRLMKSAVRRIWRRLHIRKNG